MRFFQKIYLLCSLDLTISVTKTQRPNRTKNQTKKHTTRLNSGKDVKSEPLDDEIGDHS